MENINTEQMTFTEVRHLPIVKEYAKRLNLVETIDQMVNSQMELSPGKMGDGQDGGRTSVYKFPRL